MTAQARRGPAAGLCLITSALVILLAVRHAQARYALGGFGLQVRDAIVFAVLVALLAGAAGLLDRAWRRGLPASAVPPLIAGVVLLVAVLLLAGDPQEIGYGSGGFSGAYGSQLFLDFSPELLWPAAVAVVAALGLLPVAGVAAAAGIGPRARVTRSVRVAVLLLCALSGVLLLAVLERSVALLEILHGDGQALGGLHALTWVAALWALCGVGWSALALLRSRGTAAVLALLVPVGAVVGAGALVAETDRHECCFSYATVQEVFPGAVIEPAPEDGTWAGDEYVPPPLGADLLLLAGSLAVGVGLPLGLRALQLRRVSTSASTPPG